MSICYHLFETNKEGCIFCGHTIKPQNLYKVVCPECGIILIADINLGVACDGCNNQFEAFEAIIKWPVSIE